MIKVKVKLLHPHAEMPEKAHNTDVGYDVKCVSCEYDEDMDAYVYHTGISLGTDHDDYIVTHSCFCFPRSSIRKTDCFLTNHVGIVDSDGYRGEILFTFKNRTSLRTMAQSVATDEIMKKIVSGEITKDNYPVKTQGIYADTYKAFLERARSLEFAPYSVGDRIGQMVFTSEDDQVILNEVNELDETERGAGGHGSTGK